MRNALALQSKKPKISFVLLAIAVVIVIGMVAFFFPQKGNPALPSQPNIPPNFSGTIENCLYLDRNSYGIAPAVFEALPKPPKCFLSFVQLYHSQKFSDDFFFSPNFFLQPEFYPNFERDGLPYWQNPIATHWGAIGFGSYPFERSLTAKPGETVRTRFFFHSGFGVRTFQGMRLGPEFENASDEQWVKVELDSESKNGFLLGPSYPKFDENWAKAIDVQLTVLPNAPPSTIRILLKTRAPTAEKLAEWRSKKGKQYYNATDFVGEQTAMRIVLQVP